MIRGAKLALNQANINCVVVIHEKNAGHVTERSNLIGLALFLAGKLLYFEEEGKMDAFHGLIKFVDKIFYSCNERHTPFYGIFFGQK